MGNKYPFGVMVYGYCLKKRKKQKYFNLSFYDRIPKQFHFKDQIPNLKDLQKNSQTLITETCFFCKWALKLAILQLTGKTKNTFERIRHSFFYKNTFLDKSLPIREKGSRSTS